MESINYCYRGRHGEQGRGGGPGRRPVRGQQRHHAGGQAAAEGERAATAAGRRHARGQPAVGAGRAAGRGPVAGHAAAARSGGRGQGRGPPGPTRRPGVCRRADRAGPRADGRADGVRHAPVRELRRGLGSGRGPRVHPPAVEVRAQQGGRGRTRAGAAARTRSPSGKGEQLMSKARILLVALLDMAVDIVVPTLVYLVLQPLGVPSVLSLTVGGILVGGKAAFGKLTDTGERDTVLLLASTIASLAVMFGLYAVGVNTAIAMAAGVVVQGIGVATSIIRRRRLDGFALLVLTELALGVALSFVTSGDPRFLVARPAFYTFVAAVYVFATVFRGKA